MLFLLPLGAFASCPAGLKLSNVPISTALPYCVKWESSSLGGCQVACPGVCVEFPIDGTKGPMETTGSECKLGGGDGGGDGGDPGGGDGGGPWDPLGTLFKQVQSPISVGGENQEMTTSGLRQLDSDFRLFANANFTQNKQMGATFTTFSRDLMGVTDALKTQISNNELSGKTQFEMLTSLVKTQETLQYLTNCVTNPKNNDCDFDGQPDGGDSDDKPFSLSVAMKDIQSSVDQISDYTWHSRNTLRTISADIVKANAAQSDTLGRINSNLFAVVDLLQAGQASGGAGVDYSQMPGSTQSPLHVEKATYTSTLCTGDIKCIFDLGQINKKYDESKEELKNAYKGIKDEVADIFKFNLSGSGSAPKCFDMFSMGGKSYSVCPQVDGYWEILAAIMMFIFYFVALMIVVRR
ncbi:hypothetical protein [Aeromonas sp. sia0103]|uniref:hypothetical protein n=1 Tax=Aeromonas sp. sia0103 TaxID=2854782 RepID=UPI001C472330|nr:hypothetical protein [Aeromonas sp. sia0103]MBV7597900.1 hypothetical protein [Aeromonas sp. sia0103]